MESVFCGFETLKFKQMKKIEENLNELLEVFDGTGVPNNTWVKDKLEETLIVAKNCSIHNVSVSLFNEALRMMRDLAEHQNGAPLIRHEEEYNKTMTEVWGFLEANEA